MVAIYFIFRLPAYIKGVSPVDVYLWPILRFIERGEREAMERQIRRAMGIPPEGASIKTRLLYFLSYLTHMLTFQFGWSTTFPPHRITPQLLSALPYTLVLIVPATILSIILGINLGIRIAKDPGSKKDNAITVSGLSLNALPVYWLGPFLILIFDIAFGYPQPIANLEAYPDIFYRSMNLVYMMILPIITMILGLVGSWIYLMRNSLIMTMKEEYIFTARAKGLDERTVLYRHAFKNARLPFYTNIMLSISTLWTWVIFIEVVFDIPGVGMQLYRACVMGFDYATAQTISYFIALVVIIGNLISDITYGFLDPRIRYNQ